MNADELAALAADLSPEQIDDLVQSLPPGTAEILLAELSHEDEQANLPPLLPHQHPPSSDDWDGWLLTGGRGVGKTYAGARWIGDLAADTPGLRGRIIAPTLGDAVSSVVMDPQSGIIATHPEAELKRSGVEGVRVVWPNGATIWCVGTASPSAVDRLRALTNIDCVAAGVTVATERGLVPIEKIQPGERVWTRQGLRRVLAVIDKGERPTHRLTTSAGELRGTADHRAWTGTEWREIGLFKQGDMIESCISPFRASGFTGQMIPVDTSTAREVRQCTLSSGSTSMVQCPQGMTSTTLTMTRPTTTPATCSAWSEGSTAGITLPFVTGIPNRKPRESQGLRDIGLNSLAMRLSALSVGPSSPIATMPRTGFGSAPNSAGSGIPGNGSKERIGGTFIARSAEQRHGSAKMSPQGRLPEPVAARVLQSLPTGHVERVYDLTIEGCPEFYAGGVLVHNCDLFEEAAANPYLTEAVEQARLSRRGNRLPKPLWIATTTPRPLPTIREWIKGGDGEVISVTRATTHDNPHTPDAYRRLADKLKGTRTYRQEVLGEIVDDVEGALWSFDDLKRSKRLDRKTVLDGLSTVAIGVDPPSGAGTCGIVAVGATDAGQVYVLDDYSLEDVTAGQWAHRVAEAHTDLHTLTGIEPVVVAEINQGGRMVTEVLRQASLSMPLKTVRATEGKKTRAEPVALLWEADEQHAFLSPEDVDSLAKLEDQMLTWVPGTFSPDRVDALVWAVTHLRNRPGGSARVTNPARAGRVVPQRGATSSRGRFGH